MARPRRFQFSGSAQPIVLDDRTPAVHGYAWRHPWPTASLVVVHGLQSHSQWFAEAADLLLDRGISVYALDRRGSGSSPAASGDIDWYQSWFEEVGRVVDLARRERPGVPVHLLGHCFGANLALGHALERPWTVASVVMLAPGLHVKPGYRLAEKLQILAAGVLAPTRRFRVPQDDDLFTRDPDVLAWIEGDTLGAKAVTARCLMQTKRMLSWLRNHVGDLGVPLLVIEASRDRIADNRRNGALLRGRLGDRARRVSFDAEHFLLAEPCRDQVIDELVGWVAGERRPPARRRPSTTVSVASVDVVTAELPFRFSFGHALAERRSSTNVFVKLTLSDGTTGFGEGIPRPYVTGETVEVAVSALCDRHVPALVGCKLDDPETVPALLAELATSAPRPSLPGAAWCAFELALLDAAGRFFDLPAQHWLGPVRAPILSYDAVIPFSGTRALGAVAFLVRTLGIPRVKVKVGLDLDDDLLRLRLLRRVLGADVDLRVDANCAWTTEQALAAIDRMRPYRISLVEQPVAANDLDGLCRLTATCPELIAVDESLRTVEEAEDLVAAKACDAFNIRVSKCGGLLASMRIAALAADAGLTCIVGAQVGESGILSAAGRHLAACIAPRYLEGSAGRLLLDEDVIRERVLPGWGGRARPHAGPGLGIHVAEDVLARHQRLSRLVEAAEPKLFERRPA
ncbi:MAG: alpha/beta fold hydrolase [Acidimicrobiia bacterium]